MEVTSYNIEFHGINYVINLSYSESELKIELEQCDSFNKWKNTFPQHFIEEITQKTGNQKKFSVFIKMLLSALTQKTDTVFLDLLTVQDLENLRARKGQNHLSNSQKTSISTVSNNNQNGGKRYLIISYVVEFDKVHYPLPLAYEEVNEADSLKKTIKRLQMENQELRSSKQGNTFLTNLEIQSPQTKSLTKFDILQEENNTLKQKIKRLEDLVRIPSAVDYDSERKEKTDLERKVRSLVQEHENEKRMLQLQNDILCQKLEEREADLALLRKELQNVLNNTTNQTVLKSIAKKEHETLLEEVNNLRVQDKKQKSKIKQLEEELATALKQISSQKADKFNGVIGVRTGVLKNKQNRSQSGGRSLSSNKVYTKTVKPVTTKPVQRVIATSKRQPSNNLSNRTRSISPYDRSIGGRSNTKSINTSFQSGASGGSRKTPTNTKLRSFRPQDAKKENSSPQTKPMSSLLNGMNKKGNITENTRENKFSLNDVQANKVQIKQNEVKKNEIREIDDRLQRLQDMLKLAKS